MPTKHSTGLRCRDSTGVQQIQVASELCAGVVALLARQQRQHTPHVDQPHNRSVAVLPPVWATVARVPEPRVPELACQRTTRPDFAVATELESSKYRSRANSARV